MLIDCNQYCQGQSCQSAGVCHFLISSTGSGGVLYCNWCNGIFYFWGRGGVVINIIVTVYVYDIEITCIDRKFLLNCRFWHGHSSIFLLRMCSCIWPVGNYDLWHFQRHWNYGLCCCQLCAPDMICRSVSSMPWI